MTTSLAQLLRQATEKFHDQIALVGHSGLRDDVWSYRRLSNTAESIAWQLLEVYHFSPGDRILVHGLNSPHLVANYFGCFTAGLIAVPLDRHSSIDFIVRIAKLTQATALLSSDETLQLPGLQRISPDLLASVEGGNQTVHHLPQADDIAEIVFTSGTTGNPKGVVLSHKNIITNVQAIENVYPKQPATRFLSLLPLSHMFEQTAGLFAPLCRGATIYYLNNFQSTAVMRKIDSKNINGVIAVPQMLEMILHSLEKQARADGEARWRLWWKIAEYLPFHWRRFWARQFFPAMVGTPDFFVCGGAPLPLFLDLHWELLGVRVIQGYGTTECAPVISVNHFNERIPGSVGWPVDCVKVELSEDGEILVQGDNISQGYWQNDEATRRAFTDQHHYRTGDLGELGANGELYIKGRTTDMIVLANGLNVFPEDIEQVLARQPGVTDCMVTDLPDGRGVLGIAAILCFSEDVGNEEPQLISQAAVKNTNALLAPYQRITDIRFWQGDFPRTGLMKLQRWKVKAQLLNESQSHDLVTPDPSKPTTTVAIEQLLASVCRVSEDSISDCTDLVLDLGCDSLTRVELAGLIEEQLGIICDDAELVAIHQVSELKELISRSERLTKSIRFPTWPLSDLATKLRYRLQNALILPLHKMLSVSFQVTGLENLQELSFPVIFIANHSSHVDTLSVLRAMPESIRKRLCIAAAADYFFQNNILANSLELLLNTFPFSREGSIRSSLEHCGELIDSGWSLLIYPEGTRSTTGQLQKFKTGIGYLATGLGVAVVPIAIEGGYRILPKGEIWPKRGPVLVRFGEAVSCAADMDKYQAAVLLQDRLSRLLDEQKNS